MFLIILTAMSGCSLPRLADPKKEELIAKQAANIKYTAQSQMSTEGLIPTAKAIEVSAQSILDILNYESIESRD